jgi:hypothetical protein
MASARSTTAKRVAVAVGLVLMFAATWLLLDRTEHRPGWLSVEAPPLAVVGQPLEIHVTLKRSIEPTEIVCTLHRAGTDRRLREHLASSGPARQAAAGGTYIFRFDLPETKNLFFVSAIIYLSPTGSWRDRTRAAHTKLIPVESTGAGGSATVLTKTPVYHSTSALEDEEAEKAARRPRQEPFPWTHPALFAILLSTAILCGLKASRKKLREGSRGRSERTIWLVFSAVLALCAFLEISGLVGHFASWGRRVAQERNIYDIRKSYQEAIMAAVVAAGFALCILFIKAMRRPGFRRYLWGVGMGLAVYLSVSLIGVLSFHAVDVIRDLTWHGISPVDAGRGAGALVSLFAACLAHVVKAGNPRA